MAKIKAPLFSLDASGTLDKTITYRNKPQNNTASKYAKPGDKNPFESSPRQKDQRSIIGLITACWQSKTNLDKLSWDASAKAARFKGSGYHYFLHLAKTDLKTYLGLVGFWSMNYNIGDKIPDLSGQNNHGTLSPIYPCDCPQPVDSINKKQGKAIYTDGINDYLLISGSPSLNIPEGTIFLSFKILSFNPQWCRIFEKGPYSSAGFRLLQVNSLPLRYSAYIYDITSGVKSSGPFVFTLNTWYHIAMVFTKGFLGLYVNGKLEKSITTNDYAVVTNDSIYVGRGTSSVDIVYSILDNFIIYDVPKTPQEIQRHYSLLI